MKKKTKIQTAINKNIGKETLKHQVVGNRMRERQSAANQRLKKRKEKKKQAPERKFYQTNFKFNPF